MRNDLAKLARWAALASGPVLGIAFLAGGSAEALRAATALLVCLPMAAVSIGLVWWAMPLGASWQAGSVLGGSALRILFTLAAAFLLYWSAPYCRSVTFLIWIALAYLLALALEVVVLLGMIGRADPRRSSEQCV